MAGKARQTVLPFQVERTEEPLVSHGGLALVYEVATALGLPQVVDCELPRPGSGRGYPPSQYVLPLLVLFHGGGHKLNDLRELLGMPRLPAACTVGDWLRRMGQHPGGLAGLERVNAYLVGEVLRRQEPRAGYTLDVDATSIESEKAEAQWTYQKVQGYQPLVGFLAELGLVLRERFREGNVPAGAGARAFLEHCHIGMPAGQRIAYLRSDSAFYQAEVLEWRWGHGVRFTVTADQDAAVRQALLAIPEGQWHPYQHDRRLAETVHTMNHTTQAFRLVVQRWPKRQPELFDPHPYHYHVIAPDREEAPEVIISLHNQRGEVENYFKELKSGFGLAWMPCGESYANAVFFRIGVVAYNLFVAFKLLSMGSSWRRLTIGTFRWRFFEVAGRVVRHAHGVVLKLVLSVEKLQLFQGVRERSYAVAFG